MKRRRRTCEFTVSALESRQLLSAAATVELSSGGNLIVRGSAKADKCVFDDAVQSGVAMVKVTLNGKAQYFPKASITGAIHFLGGYGNDYCNDNVQGIQFLGVGESGNDTLIGSDGTDFLIGGDGDDLLDGYKGNDCLYGDSFTENSADGEASPEKGRDSLYGGDGNDYLSGGALNDLLEGRGGDDTLFGGGGDDTLTAGSGRDFAWGGWGNDHLYGNEGVDDLIGEEGNDALYGGADYDYLYGSDGDDFLDGEADDAYYNGGTGLDTAANQPVIGGVSYADIFQNGSSSCWFLASLGAMTTLGATSHGADISSYLSYAGNGVYNVRIWNFKSKKWTTQSVNFEGNGSTNSGDATVRNNGDTSADNAACEGEFWATVIHRGMLKYYKADYTTASGIAKANFGYGAGKGGIAVNGLLLLGNTTAVSDVKDKKHPYNLAYLTKLKGLLNRTNPIQPIIAGTIASPTSKKLVGAHAYQITAIDGSGNVTLRNPWGTDGGSVIDGANDGIVTITASEFAGSFSQVAYTTSPVV